MKYEKKEIEVFIKNEDPLIEFIKPKQTPKSSRFWSSFRQVLYKKVKQDVIQCETCESILIHRSIDGTKVMSTHMKACKQTNQFDTSEKVLQACSLSKKPIPRKAPSKIKKAITDACAEFVAIDNRAFETVKGNGFVNLMENIFTAGQHLSKSANVKVTDLLPDPSTVRIWYAL